MGSMGRKQNNMGNMNRSGGNRNNFGGGLGSQVNPWLSQNASNNVLGGMGRNLASDQQAQLALASTLLNNLLKPGSQMNKMHTNVSMMYELSSMYFVVISWYSKLSLYSTLIQFYRSLEKYSSSFYSLHSQH